MKELLFKNIDIYSKDGFLFKSTLCREYEQLLTFYPEYRKLQMHQRIAANFFQPNSRFNSLLLYHGTGLGKTPTAITAMNNVLTFTQKLNVIILCPASLRANVWIPNIRAWSEDKNLIERVTFVSVDSPTFMTEFDMASKTLTMNVPAIIIIDECHLLISSLLDEESNRKTVYTQLLYIVKNYKVFLICMTATPVVNKVEELVYLFNLLRPDTFHSKESIFSEMFMNSLNGKVKNQHTFCKRVTGLVSYFETLRKKEMPEVTSTTVRLPMSPEQSESYEFAELEESRKGSGGYKQLSIAMCNFAPLVNLLKSGVTLDFASIIAKASENELRAMSPKFTHIIEQIIKSSRPNIVHTSYIKSTMLPFEAYLRRAGFSRLGEPPGASGVYAVISGETSTEERERVLAIFNGTQNMHSAHLRVLVISDVFSTGVTLKYVENLFVMNYHWNSAKIKQVYGRIERINTHVDLPPAERFVRKFIYVMTRDKGSTADQALERVTVQKDVAIDMFMHLLKISSFDFEFNQANAEFAYCKQDAFKVSLHEILAAKPFIRRSIMDEDGIFKNAVAELRVSKLNTKQVTVVYFDKKAEKKQLVCLLVHPVFHYYLVDAKYYNFIGHLNTVNGRPVFDKDTNFFVATILVN